LRAPIIEYKTANYLKVVYRLDIHATRSIRYTLLAAS